MKLFFSGYFLFCLLSGIAAQKKFYTCHEVTADEFHAWQQGFKNLLVIDIRSKEEFDESHIPRAKWVFGDSALISVSDTLDADQLILIYDNSDFESIDACLLLASRGKLSVFHLKDGFDEWKKLGYVTENSKKLNH